MHGQEQEDRGVKTRSSRSSCIHNGSEARASRWIIIAEEAGKKERIYFFTMVIFAFKPLFARNPASLPSMSVVRVPMRTRNISW